MKDIDLIVQSIITHQREVLGPLAIEQVKGIDGLSVSDDGKVKIVFSGNVTERDLLTKLAKRYEKLFGKASIEVCKDAIKEAGVEFSDDELPEILRS